MEQLLITKADFESIRQIATHCSYDVLTPFIIERQNLDLTDKLCAPFYFDILKNTSNYNDLLNGCGYTDCNGNNVYHFGLKRALIHFAYASLVMDGNFKHTPFGMVQKMHEDSMPVESVDLKKIHDRNRRIGNSYLDMTIDYICKNKEEYPLYTKKCSCNCASCSKIIKTRSHSFKVIKK